MAIIMDYYYGPTHIIVYDDHVVPKEEVPAILERIGENAYRALLAAKIRLEQEKQEIKDNN